jgi:hypothetical protein
LHNASYKSLPYDMSCSCSSNKYHKIRRTIAVSLSAKAASPVTVSSAFITADITITFTEFADYPCLPFFPCKLTQLDPHCIVVICQAQRGRGGA